MGSSSKPQKPMEKYEIIEGSTTGSGKMTPFQTVAMNPNGRRNSISVDGNIFYQSDDDDDLYYLSTGGTKHENYIRVRSAASQEAESKGKGDGYGGANNDNPSTGPSVSIIDTNPGVGYDGWQQQMANYYPVTPNQSLNPLVNPGNWMYTPDPQYGILNNPGLYVNNPRPLGVLS